MTFLHPQLLWLLLLLPALLIIYIVWRRRQQASLRVPSLLFISGVRGGLRVYLRHVLFALRLLALGLIIVALARPQSSSSWSEDRVEGIGHYAHHGYLDEYAGDGLPAQPRRGCQGGGYALHRQSPE